MVSPALWGCPTPPPPPCLTLLMPELACPAWRTREKCLSSGHKTARMRASRRDDGPGNAPVVLRELPTACGGRAPRTGHLGRAGAMLHHSSVPRAQHRTLLVWLISGCWNSRPGPPSPPNSPALAARPADNGQLQIERHRGQSPGARGQQCPSISRLSCSWSQAGWGLREM